MPAAIDPPADLREPHPRRRARRAAERAADDGARRPCRLDEPAQRRADAGAFALRLFAASMAAAAVVAGVLAFMQRQEADDLRERAVPPTRVAALLATPGTRSSPSSGPDGPAAPRWCCAEGQAPVLVSTLGDAPADRTYQIWGIPDDGGAPRSLGFAGEGSDVVAAAAPTPSTAPARWP